MRRKTTGTANHPTLILHPIPESTVTQSSTRSFREMKSCPGSRPVPISFAHNSEWRPMADHRRPLKNRFDRVRGNLCTSPTCATLSQASVVLVTLAGGAELGTSALYAIGSAPLICVFETPVRYRITPWPFPGKISGAPLDQWPLPDLLPFLTPPPLLPQDTLPVSGLYRLTHAGYGVSILQSSGLWFCSQSPCRIPSRVLSAPGSWHSSSGC